MRQLLATAHIFLLRQASCARAALLRKCVALW